MRRPLAVAAVAAAIAGLVASCREPTQITVTVSTDAKCSDIQGVSIAIGVLGDELEKKPASALSFKCDPSTGRVGSIVIVPSGPRTDEVSFRVTAGFGKNVDDCKTPFGQGCVVARRAIRYLPHTPLFVPVKLSVICNGIPCGASSTCESGSCVDAHVDPAKCESPSGCELSDGGTHDAGPPTSLPIATVGNVPAETGTAQQQHVVYATRSGRWWFFYIDDAAPTLLKTLWSPDFATWTAGASFTLADGTANEARNFSVAYADLGGNDVVHIVYSHHLTGDAAADHIRATINGATIAYSPETNVASSTYFPAAADPDGPVVAVSSDGHVFVATGWINENRFQGMDTTGNMDLFESTTPDDGTSVGPISNYVFHNWVREFDNNRALVPFGAGEILAVWPLADGAPDTDDLSWATSKASWLNSANVFGDGLLSAPNDWSACGVSATSVHVVRRLVNGGANDVYQHRRFDANAGTWSAGDAIPAEGGAYGTGVVLLTNGTKLGLFAIDATSSVRYTTWDGVGWSAWRTLFGATTKRAFLAGSGCTTRAVSAITWTEGGTSPYRAMGAEVTKLF